MISNPEKRQCRQIIQSPQWKVVEMIANEMCNKINSDSNIRDSEWETVKTTLINDGMVRGIRNFIQEIYNNALANDET